MSGHQGRSQSTIGGHRSNVTVKDLAAELNKLQGNVRDFALQTEQSEIKQRAFEDMIEQKQQLQKLAAAENRAVPKFQPTVLEVLHEKFRKLRGKAGEPAAPDVGTTVNQAVEQLQSALNAPDLARALQDVQGKLSLVNAEYFNATQGQGLGDRRV
jgi:hypothetical protein